MIGRAHSKLGLCLGLLLVPLAACGDDDGDGAPADGGVAGTSAGSGGASGSGGRAGAGSGGSGALRAEGERCANARDCAAELECVATTFRNVRICARGCLSSNDCTDGEVCGSPYTQTDADAHCINLVTMPYGECGAFDTAACDPRADLSCLLSATDGSGICVTLCELEGASDEDAGVPTGMCQAPQTCVSGVAQAGPGEADVGVCGTEVARNEECESQIGKYCMGTDLCAPDDPENAPGGISHCREDCTESNTCVTGTCTPVDGDGDGAADFSYCRH